MAHFTRARFNLRILAAGIAFVLLSSGVLLFTINSVFTQLRERGAVFFARTMGGELAAHKLGLNEWLYRLRNEVGSTHMDWWIVDPSGGVVVSTAPAPLPIDWSRVRPPERLNSYERLPRSLGWRYELAAVRLATEPQKFALIRVDLYNSMVLNVFLWVAGFGFWTLFGVVAVAAYFTYTYTRSRSVEAISVLGRLQSGELSARFRITRIDEVGRLMIIFNRMADEIQGLVGRLREAQRRRTQLLQEVSHDLRTPLTSSRVALETLDTQYEKLGESDRRRFTAMAHGEIRFLQQLIEDIFTLAEVEEPRARESIESVDLRSLVSAEVERRRSADPRFTWRLEADPEVGLVGNPRLLERLVRNACDNAATHAKRAIEVRLRRVEGAQVELTFSDDGDGVSPEEVLGFGQRRVERLPSGAFASGASLGLGSVIMRSIAELHGGGITLGNWYASEGGRPAGALLKIDLLRAAPGNAFSGA